MNRIAVAALAALVFFVFAGPVAAQQVAGTDAMVTGLAERNDDTDEMKLRLFRIGAAASAPLLLQSDDKLFVGVGYDLLLRQVKIGGTLDVDGQAVAGEDAITDNRLEDELHLSALTLFYVRKINARWSVNVRGSVRYGGDYAALVARGIQPVGAVGAAVQITDTFRLAFGLAYVESLEPVYVAPYVGWKWTPTDWFTSKGALPVAATFTFNYHDLLEWDIFARTEGGEFWVASNDLDVDYYQYVQVQAGSGFGFRIVDDLWFSVQAGGTPYLLFEGREADGDVALDGTYAQTWFARVLIELRSLPGQGKKTTYTPAHPVENPEPVHQ